MNEDDIFKSFLKDTEDNRKLIARYNINEYLLKNKSVSAIFFTDDLFTIKRYFNEIGINTTIFVSHDNLTIGTILFGEESEWIFFAHLFGFFLKNHKVMHYKL